RRHTLSYRKFGPLEVSLLDPAYWSIGKMTRYLDSDIRDMRQVFKKRRISPARLARIWGKALKKSPRSAALGQFRKQAEHFIKTYGRKIWGKRFKNDNMLRGFYKEAGIYS